MSHIGEDPSAEAWRQLRRQGVTMDHDRIPVPTPHWQRSLNAVQQNDDDLLIYNREQPEAWILAEDGSHIFTLEDCR